MSQLKDLKAATTLNQVAALLRFKPSALSYMLYVREEPAKYTKFDIPKRSGGVRQISAPIDSLKLLQRNLADLLQNCYDDINESNKRGDKDKNPDRIAHGFKRNRSIVTNARWHRNKRYVFNIDLEDFFGTINFGRIRGFFLKDKNFSLHPKVATILAQIASFEKKLPQGSPCSPVISNLIGHVLDIHLAGLAARTGCTYTRYADDLTFSTNKQNFPELIAERVEESNHTWLPGRELSRLIENSGFAINSKKTRMQYRDSRQEVTGLIVNNKVNVRHEYRHTVRAMVHRLLTKGTFDFEYTETNASGEKVAKKSPGKLDQLHGMLGFIDGVDLLNKRIASKTPGKTLTSKELMYRRFLLFKHFYGAPAPVLLCEGKTDNVYLTHALRSLSALYPKLAEVDASGKITLKIRRFKYTGTSTGRILGISGGSGDLSQFMRTYKNEVSRFQAPGKMHPVIVLIDNDSGAAPIYNTIKDLTGIKPSGTENFIKIFGNLYVVPTPSFAKGSSMIEDFFDPITTAVLVKGKSFDPSNNFDPKTHYGKADFAYRVVQPNADKIDFSAFRSILDRFVEVIDEHTKIHPASGISL